MKRKSSLFEHENIQLAKAILQKADELDTKTLEGALSAVLIYVNAVDYVCSHLLKDLKLMVHYVSKQEFNSVVFLKDVERDEIPLGSLINRLKLFEFPNKVEFIKKLKEFNKYRKKLIHQLMFTDESGLKNIDSEVSDMFILSKDIINDYDSLKNGMLTTWQQYLKTKEEPVGYPLECE